MCLHVFKHISFKVRLKVMLKQSPVLDKSTSQVILICYRGDVNRCLMYMMITEVIYLMNMMFSEWWFSHDVVNMCWSINCVHIKMVPFCVLPAVISQDT